MLVITLFFPSAILLENGQQLFSRAAWACQGEEEAFLTEKKPPLHACRGVEEDWGGAAETVFCPIGLR